VPQRLLGGYTFLVASTDRAPAAPGLRERKKQLTRQRIAETARRLFGERGFERVTIAEIARAADVSEQTVFNYFPTKEDLVFWRLGAFEDALLAAVRERPPGQSALEGFRGFLMTQRGLLGRSDPDARAELAALTRVIVESPALRAREQQILAGYTESLAELLAEETGADADDVAPLVAANALVAIHRALIHRARRGIVAGTPQRTLARALEEQAERAFAMLAGGLGDYAVRPPEP
jgi:AcrR family transcriptional regulator